MSAREWKPGDRAYIEVEVEDVTRMSGVDTAFVWVQSTRPGLGRSVGVRVPAANLLASPDATRQAKAGSVVHSPASIKSVGEALKYAEAALLNFYHDNGQRSMYAEILRELLADIERQRPTGPDGKHGDRHTPTCGCADRIGGE